MLIWVLYLLSTYTYICACMCTHVLYLCVYTKRRKERKKGEKEGGKRKERKKSGRERINLPPSVEFQRQMCVSVGPHPAKDWLCTYRSVFLFWTRHWDLLVRVLLCLNAVAVLRTSPACNLPRHVVHAHTVVTHDGWPGLNCSTDLGGRSKSNYSKCRSPRQTLWQPSWLWLSTDNSHMLCVLRKVCMTSPPAVYPTPQCSHFTWTH